MGAPGGVNDLAQRVQSGAFSGTGAGAGVALCGPFNLSVWGTFVATVVVERSFDGGTTWLPLSLDTYGTTVSLTAPCSLIVSEPETGVLYRLRCSAFTSGTASWRLSQ